jgi:hypothetical protein
MRLIDKIALNRLLSIIASFILAVLKILAPKSVEELDVPEPDKPIWKPRWRRKKDE